jgi:hypothetical protein
MSSRIFRTTTPVLSRAVWSSHKACYILLRHLIAVERTNGSAGNAARRYYPRVAGASELQLRVSIVKRLRSSDSHLVKASGLRWLSLMLLVPIGWAQRVWALPFLTVLASSQRYHEQRNHRHKHLTD